MLACSFKVLKKQLKSWWRLGATLLILIFLKASGQLYENKFFFHISRKRARVLENANIFFKNSFSSAAEIYIIKFLSIEIFVQETR